MALLSLLCTTQPALAGEKAPPELGDIAWGRDLDEGLRRSRASGRPVLLLFDEVPGCQTVLRYGREVLSHPLLVEAAQDHFVPVAIYNNVGGRDREVLQHFQEPAWNNPVVRLLDASRRELAPRVADGTRTPAELARAMTTALGKAGRPVPAYLEVLASSEELGLATATVTTACFWAGEATLGALPGVVQTEAGFAQGREVVRVRYDPDRVTPKELARAGPVRPGEEPFSLAASDRKYHLRRSELRLVPLTATQAARVNAALASGGDPEALLSPRQRQILAAVRARPGEGWPEAALAEDFPAAMRAALARLP